MLVRRIAPLRQGRFAAAGQRILDVRRSGNRVAKNVSVPLVRDPLVHTVLAFAIDVHRQLGPGLLESTYQKCLAHELTTHNVAFVQNHHVPLTYKGLELDCGYRLDLLVERRVVVELKSVEQVLPIHKAQVLTYLKLLKISHGLLINFNVARLVDGVTSLFVAPERMGGQT